MRTVDCNPSWLRHFTSEASFFGVCPKCCSAHSAREATCNLYSVATGETLCSVCAQGHDGTLLQVRRSSYHDVVRAQDVAKLADVSGIQAYTINGARVLFLRRRPQPRPPKGAVGPSQCTVCNRHLQDVSLYCSLQCKLDASAGASPACLRTHPAGSDSSDSHGSHAGPDTPSHLTALRLVESSASDTESMDCHEGMFCHKRRKGNPHRAFLQ
ncbi:hypothetical protein N2152v2_009417 [Parachlorella kessleri]